MTKQIRFAKTTHCDKLSNKLKADNLNSKAWWKTLQSFIKPSTKNSIPSHSKYGVLFFDNKVKGDELNEHFTTQTILRETNVELPTISLDNNRTVFLYVEIIPRKVTDVLQSLTNRV